MRQFERRDAENAETQRVITKTKVYRTFHLSSLEQLHLIVRDIFEHSLGAVDPVSAVQRAIKIDGSQLEICGNLIEVEARPLYAIAIGKAASSMAIGLTEGLGDQIVAGVLSGPGPYSFNSTRWQILAGGHPTPNEESLAAAQAAFKLLDQANGEEAIVIALISGGGSAMMEWPVNAEITLEELRSANQMLVNSGASISEINVVRRAFSAVKGGGLARRAPNANLTTLIVSDTNKGDEASVASGPTLEAPTSSHSAIEIVSQYQLESTLPESIIKSIRSTRFLQPIAPAAAHVLLDNQTALNAAARRAQTLGYAPVVATEISEQPIEDGVRQLIERLNSAPAPACIISGGEFSCPARGDGRGGRNLETVLRCAQFLDDQIQTGNWQVAVLSAGTDGIDGNSPASGAIADNTTITRAKAMGLDALDFLRRSDSYSFFEKLDDVIITGPTGTNVRDLRIVLRIDGGS